MSRRIVHSDGVESIIPEEWKCNFIENFIEMSDSPSSAPVPVQYAFTPTYFEKEIISFSSINFDDPLFPEMIEECLDFWNYLDCKDRMYFFYYVMFEYYLSDEKCPHTKRKIFYVKHFLDNNLKNIHNKDYYRELESILLFLIGFPSDENECSIHLSSLIYGNEDVLLDFIVYSSVNFNTLKSKNYDFPMILSMVKIFAILNTKSFYSQKYEYPEVEYLERIIKKLIEKIDWVDGCILEVGHNFQHYDFFEYVIETGIRRKIKDTNIPELILKKNWKLHLDILKDCNGNNRKIISRNNIFKFERLTYLLGDKLIFNPNVEFYISNYDYNSKKEVVERASFDEKKHKFVSRFIR